MTEMTETPQANRVHIAFFGLRNAGKSTLVNEFCGQHLAIVHATPGTTTDPVSKAMEILPLGPCLITDTAGLDDEGELGEQRVAKTLKVLETTDIAVWVDAGRDNGKLRIENVEAWKATVREKCARCGAAFLEYKRGECVEELKKRIAAVKIEDDPGLLDGLASSGDRIVLVCPIDESAPKGRLILPQVQVLRECLDRHVIASVCQVEELKGLLSEISGKVLVITDSQAFKEVSGVITSLARPEITLTSFSILFARQKGNLEEFRRGLDAIAALKEGDTVLVAEACTHHRQCNDIGTTKIPKAVTKFAGGKKLNFVYASGKDFLTEVKPALIVHCGGCMLTRRAMLARIAAATERGIPIVNYGLLLQKVLSNMV